jgi:tetratricopeptide (TPR) repeat protein
MSASSEDRRLARAVALQQRALSENDAARPVAAAALLGRALTLVSGAQEPNHAAFEELSPRAAALAVRILITRAKSEAELSGLGQALGVLDIATGWAAERGDRSVGVSIANQRGLLYLRFGDTVEALAEFERAEPRFRSAPPLDVCKVLLNRGVARLDRGELAAARRDLSRCVVLATRSGLTTIEAMAEHNIGYLEFLCGNIVKGLEAMQTAARPAAGIPMGVSYLDRARLLVEAGLTREADSALEQAAAIFRRDRMAQDLAETELARAECALLAGDLSAARRFAGQARDRFRRRDNDRWRRSAELLLLQADLADRRPGPRLVGPARRLFAEFSGAGLRLPARTAALIAAQACHASGQLETAERILTDLPPSRPADPITSRLHTRYVSAVLAEARGASRQAKAQVRAGLAELVQYQARFGSIDLRTASAVHGQRLAALDLELTLRSRRPTDVFAAAERARAVSNRLPSVRSPKDPRAAELLTELRRTVESLRAVEQDRAAQAPLLRRRHELEREVVSRGWTLAGAGAARPTARLGEVRAAITVADATMVVFVEAAGTMHAVVLRDGLLRLRELGDSAAITEQIRRARADLDVLAQPRLPGGLSAAVRSSFDRSVVELDRSLLGPLHLDGQRLVIVSTGILGQLPWGTLPSLRGVPVVVAPSATAWLSAMQAPARRRKRQVFALAGPDLVRADHEVAGVEAAWGAATTHTGEAATRPAVAKAMARGSVVHVAAHGVHQTENPLFSSLRLVDGPMFAHEMDQTARTPEHVVLSACELGLATVRPGDEALGLTSVLLHLGTRSVVAGVARVGDELAAETMIAYHQRLAAGQDSAAALAEAASAAGVPVPFVCFGASYR